MEVTKGDATCPDVLACSLYVTDTVQIISTVADNVKWNPIKNKFYSNIEMKTANMSFHHLNVIHMYNFGMGSVNVSDQFCMKYRDWMRNRKWWWSIFI